MSLRALVRLAAAKTRTGSSAAAGPARASSARRARRRSTGGADMGLLRAATSRYIAPYIAQSAARPLGVLGNAVAERPVFLDHFDQVDEHVLRAHAQPRVQAIGHGAIESLLGFDASALADRDLDEDAVVAALDAHVGAVN